MSVRWSLSMRQPGTPRRRLAATARYCSAQARSPLRPHKHAWNSCWRCRSLHRDILATRRQGIRATRPRHRAIRWCWRRDAGGDVPPRPAQMVAGGHRAAGHRAFEPRQEPDVPHPADRLQHRRPAYPPGLCTLRTSTRGHRELARTTISGVPGTAARPTADDEQRPKQWELTGARFTPDLGWPRTQGRQAHGCSAAPVAVHRSQAPHFLPPPLLRARQMQARNPDGSQWTPTRAQASRLLSGVFTGGGEPWLALRAAASLHSCASAWTPPALAYARGPVAGISQPAKQHLEGSCFAPHPPPSTTGNQSVRIKVRQRAQPERPG